MSEITIPYNYKVRSYQRKAWLYFQRPIDGLRGACVWHRRAGKDLMSINLVALKHTQRVGMYWHLLPTYKQGRAIVWNGFTRDGRRFLDHFPEQIVRDRNKTEMRVTFTNGSMYQVVGTDDVNNLVGTNPIGCIFSEYSLQDPAAWNYIRPILAENGGWALFIYTARGKNHGYDMMQMAQKNPDWFHEVLVAGDNGTKRDDGSPVLSDKMIQAERDAGMEEALIQQEFYCSFDAPLVGSYYGEQMARLDKLGRIMSVPWEPLLPVHTAWDLGIDDEMVIWFIQEGPEGPRVIDIVKRSGEGLIHMIKILKGQEDGHEEKAEFVYGRHFAPHDIQVRELTSGDSRLDTAKKHGVRFTVVPNHEVTDGIEAVRQLLPLCYFDATKTDPGVQALKSYRKDYDEKNKTFRSTPLHDWSSHAADAFRYYAMGRKRGALGRRTGPPPRCVDNHDYLA